jgi:drug/metabolite transporter superfamily protein YnfA
MNPAVTGLLLIIAAALEVGGDAVVRLGLKQFSGWPQFATIAAGGIVLLAYGLFVNWSPLDFGRLLGIYVVLFFVVAQLTNLLVFDVRPSASILVGGLCIAAGGLVITFWKG